MHIYEEVQHKIVPLKKKSVEFQKYSQFYVGLPHIYAYFKICVQSIRRQLILAPIIPGNFHKNQHSTKGKQKKRKP
jgi:hypothetical protein